MKQSKITILLIFIFVNGFSQDLKIIYGKLTSKEQIPIGVKIVNLKTEREATSDANGKFAIIVKLGDLLIFSSENYDYEHKIIEEKDFALGTISIDLTRKIEQLEEVVIKNNNEINAVSLGILSKPAKVYTLAERKLYTASDGTDGFINMLTGRKKMLERAAAFEKNEILLAKINRWFDDNYFTNTLKINKENVNRFKYFAIENKKASPKLQIGNKLEVSFLLSQLATEFNKIQNQKK